MIFNLEKTEFDIEITSRFKSEYKIIRKQGKNINKLISVLETLANGEELMPKYRDHELNNDKIYKD